MVDRLIICCSRKLISPLLERKIHVGREFSPAPGEEPVTDSPSINGCEKETLCNELSL